MDHPGAKPIHSNGRRKGSPSAHQDAEVTRGINVRNCFAVIVGLSMISSFSFAAEGPGSGRSDKPRDRQEDRDDHEDGGPVRAGYAIITPMATTTAANALALVVFATFGFQKGEETTQAGILPSVLSRDVIMFLNTLGRLSRNLGIGITNPRTAAANVTFALFDDMGHSAGTSKTVAVKGMQQTAQFVTDIFGDRPEIPRNLTGTLRITSDMPVGIVGLRFRGSNFSSLPITNLSPSTAIPVREGGIGGSNAVLLSRFASGGGWATELVLLNTGLTDLTVRADFFKQDGSAMTVRLNGQSASSFKDLKIPPGGVLELAPKNKDGESRF